VRSMRVLVSGFFVLLAIGSASAQTSDSALKALMISAPRPEYPEEARVRHVTGCGIYQVEFDSKTGVPQKVSAIQSAGIPLLNRAATTALMQWRAKPPA